MSGRTNTRSWLLLGAVAAAAVLTLPPLGGADSSPSVSHLRAENVNLAAQARSAALSLYSIDSQLAQTRSNLAVLGVRAARLEARQRQTGQELRLATVDEHLAVARVASRLRYLYDYGSATSSLDVVLGASSLSQALSRLNDSNAVAAADRDVISQLIAAKGELNGLSQTLAREHARLAGTATALTDTVHELVQTQAQRTTYLGDLQSREALTTAAINRLNAEALAAEARAQELAQERAAQAQAARTLAADAPATGEQLNGSDQSAAAAPAVVSATTGAPTGSDTITVVATGYDLTGHTATGLPVGYGVAAVDPSVIPLGAHMTVPGYGEAVAADTGGSIVGDRVDLWFPTAAQANAWGRRTVTIVVSG